MCVHHQPKQIVLPLNNVHVAHRNSYYIVCDDRRAEQSSGDLIEIRCAFIDAVVWHRTYNHTIHADRRRHNPISA